jgi:hypothetical protein
MRQPESAAGFFYALLRARKCGYGSSTSVVTLLAGIEY